MPAQNDPWSERDLKLLAKLYPDMQNEDICLFFEGRSKSAIEHKAQRRGLKKSAEFLASRKSGRYLPAAKPSFIKRFINFFKNIL